jgi:hypothetical protein
MLFLLLCRLLRRHGGDGEDACASARGGVWARSAGGGKNLHSSMVVVAPLSLRCGLVCSSSSAAGEVVVGAEGGEVREPEEETAITSTRSCDGGWLRRRKSRGASDPSLPCRAPASPCSGGRRALGAVQRAVFLMASRCCGGHLLLRREPPLHRR